MFSVFRSRTSICASSLQYSILVNMLTINHISLSFKPEWLITLQLLLFSLSMQFVRNYVDRMYFLWAHNACERANIFHTDRLCPYQLSQPWWTARGLASEPRLALTGSMEDIVSFVCGWVVMSPTQWEAVGWLTMVLARCLMSAQ